MASVASELGIDDEMRNSYMGQMGLTLAFGMAAAGVVAAAPAAPEIGMGAPTDTMNFTV